MFHVSNLNYLFKKAIFSNQWKILFRSSSISSLLQLVKAI